MSATGSLHPAASPRVRLFPMAGQGPGGSPADPAGALAGGAGLERGAGSRACRFLRSLGLGAAVASTLLASMWPRAEAASSAPVVRPVGEKIEFSAPRESTTVRPSSGMELPSARSGRRDTPADGADLITSMPLPPASDVNRLRLLQELLGRRRQADGTELSLPTTGMGMKLNEGLEVDAASTRLGIDDLFERQRGRLGSEERDNEELRRSGTNPDDRLGSDRDRDRDRDWDRDRNDGRGSRDREPKSSRDSGRNGGLSESGQEKRFLPQGVGQGDDFRDALVGRGRDGDERFSPGAGERLSGSWLSGPRDRDDLLKSREERMESFRRILGGGTTVDSWLSTAGRVGPGDSSPVPGMLGGPGPGTGGGRSLGETLDARGGAAATGASGGPETGVDRSFALPSRPLELNIGAGRTALGVSDSSAAAPDAVVRPMELFQRKHDTRIPSRGF